MKKIFVFGFAFLSLMALMTSCKKNDTSGGGASTTTDSLHVFLSSPTCEYNGFDFVTVTVKDQNGNDITSTTDIYANDNYISSKFIPTGTGTYYIKAKKGTIPSDTKECVATAPSASPFSQKILLEDCTGAWCGYCPRVANSLDNYKASRPNCIVLGVHGGGGTDPYKYQYYTTFNSYFNVSGYPSAILNRKSTWNESTSVLNAELNKWAPLGLAIESSLGATSITGKAKVKFNVTTDRPMKIVIALVESGLVYPQVNYYSPSAGATPYLYGGANPITGFVHNNVLRKASTDIFGDAIPVTAQVKNGEWELPFSFGLTGSTATGTTYTVVGSNCSIVAFVVDASVAKKGTYNVQYAPVGIVKNYD
ncbi:MAG: Omp28-related outer membrane protein [Chitinophagaceae bacterium]